MSHECEIKLREAHKTVTRYDLFRRTHFSRVDEQQHQSKTDKWRGSEDLVRSRTKKKHPTPPYPRWIGSSPVQDHLRRTSRPLGSLLRSLLLLSPRLDLLEVPRTLVPVAPSRCRPHSSYRRPLSYKVEGKQPHQQLRSSPTRRCTPACGRGKRVLRPIHGALLLSRVLPRFLVFSNPGPSQFPMHSQPHQHQHQHQQRWRQQHQNHARGRRGRRSLPQRAKGASSLSHQR